MDAWSFAKQPVTEETHDGLRVTEIRFLFPPEGVPSGGELRYVRTRAGTDLGVAVTIPFEPGEPDSLAELAAWCRDRLKARGILPSASVPVKPKAKLKAPVAEPGIALG